MTKQQTIDFLMAEVKALEKKKETIKKNAKKRDRYLYIHEEDKIKRMQAKQMILRKMARKINKLQ